MERSPIFDVIGRPSAMVRMALERWRKKERKKRKKGGDEKEEKRGEMKKEKRVH